MRSVNISSPVGVCGRPDARVGENLECPPQISHSSPTSPHRGNAGLPHQAANLLPVPGRPHGGTCADSIPEDVHHRGVGPGSTTERGYPFLVELVRNLSRSFILIEVEAEYLFHESRSTRLHNQLAVDFFVSEWDSREIRDSRRGG